MTITKVLAVPCIPAQIARAFRLPSLLTAILFLAPLLRAQAAPSSRPLRNGDRVENLLLPFTSDGCSSFPNGIPYKDENRWLKCCVIHDISYWQGGPAEKRLAADQALKSCVAETGEKTLSEAMYLGVRAGGHALLPTSWKWGYGWTLDRGYAPLSPDDEKQVAERLKALPARLEDVPIASVPAVPQRKTLTGDYCLDAALQHLLLVYGGGFTYLGHGEEDAEGPEGLLKTLSITTQNCSEPFRFTFLLLRPDACKVPANELAVRGRIRLARIETPTACSK